MKKKKHLVSYEEWRLIIYALNNLRSSFIAEGRDFEDSRNIIYSIMRLSFMAGWKSAGGEPPPTRPGIAITPKKPDE